jgi:putative nucleotidyltransferase with HDIG domain
VSDLVLASLTQRLDVERRTAAYAAVLAVCALLLGAALILGGMPLGASPWAVLTLAVISCVFEQSRIRLTQRVEISISLLPTLFAAVAFGPIAAMVVAAASMLGDLRRDRLKWAVYTPSEALTGGLAGLVAAGVLERGPHGLGGMVLATLLATATAQLLDLGFCSLTLRVRDAADPRQIARTAGPLLLGSLPLYVPVVAIVAYAYHALSPWTLPLFLAPTLAAQRLFVMYQGQRELADELSRVNRRLEGANLSFATALVATLEARDRYTAGHSAAVAVYARDIAEQMGLSMEQQQLARVTGLVHDIGKIGLPPTLLEKAGPLTLSERRQMETHSEIGEKILLNVEDYADVARYVRHHHERVDGMGYPDGLSGDIIPLISRIIAVADAYNAMTSDRPYRDAMPSRVARLRLAQAVGSQFDVAVVAAFEAILAQASEEYRFGQSPTFVLNEDGVRPLLVATTGI